MNIKSELNIIKEIVELECADKVKVIFAEKQGWLLLKTKNHLKTIGCIRFNKNSFATLYIDTKDGILLEDELPKLNSRYNNIDIKSRPTGNFTQNKFKFMSESEVDLITEAINAVFEKDIVMTEKRVRHMSASSEIVA